MAGIGPGFRPAPELPAHIFTTPDEVKKALGIGPYDDVDDEWLLLVVKAVNMLITELRPDLIVCGPGEYRPEYYSDNDFKTLMPQYTWRYSERVRLGAVMLATRWYKRRGGEEVAAYTEFGGPPPTIDKDIEILLEINRGFRAVVA